MASAIIVSAGKGRRMKEKIPKQYLTIAGIPIISHTLDVFTKCPLIHHIFLVVSPEDKKTCKKNIIDQMKTTKSIQIVSGGRSRQESVFRGIMAMESEKEIVVIHDGVRPFVDTNEIVMCIQEAAKSGACILGIPAFDTLKQVNQSGKIEKTIDRDIIWLAQTPQAFQFDIIKKAHKNAQKRGLTGSDDAFLVEQIGHPITIIKGSQKNIKITTPEDLSIAEAICKSNIKSN